MGQQEADDGPHYCGETNPEAGPFILSILISWFWPLPAVGSLYPPILFCYLDNRGCGQENLVWSLPPGVFPTFSLKILDHNEISWFQVVMSNTCKVRQRSLHPREEIHNKPPEGLSYFGGKGVLVILMGHLISTLCGERPVTV